MSKLIAKYKNGNYTVRLFDNGTKIRMNKLDNLTPDFAESMDVTITTVCNGGCKYCLTEDNLIETNNGQLKISELKENDLVISYNKNLNQKEIKKVINISKRYYSGELIKLEFENNHIILCTPNHKIYTKNRGYIQAKDLTIDDEFIEY